MRRRAFTLLELLVVVGIVALLAALLFPVLASAKERGRKTVCASNMHQIGLAILMYRDTDEGWPISRDLTTAPLQGVDKRLWLCPSDPLKGYASLELSCVHNRQTRVDQSYFHPFSPSQSFTKRLEAFDSNFALLACRTHGQRTEFFTGRPDLACTRSPAMFEGTVQRVRRDGSLGNGHMTLTRTESGGYQFRVADLFVDKAPGSP